MPEAGYLPIPAKLARTGVKDMVRISDARMSGTAYGTIVLHVSPEAAVGGPLALVKTGDRIRLSVAQRSINLMVDEAEVGRRRAAGRAPTRMMRGTGCCAITDPVRLTKHAVKLGCGGVLMLPPFYYKGVSDDGLFRNFAEIVERVGDSGLRIYLYHIPPVSNVPITLTLIERLLKAYPGTIAGAKDSSGDWNNTKAMLDQFAKSGFDVFPGAETFLLAGMRNGGAGCISATANTNPAAIARLYDTWRGADADAQQKRLDEIRGTFAKYPMIPALKAAIAHWSGIADWATVRPPLVALTKEQAASLVSDLKAKSFDMPGLGR